MTTTKSQIRRGAYFDSIVLMQLQRSLAALPGVEDAGVVMGTPANLELLADGGLLPPKEEKVGPDDLVIVVRGENEKAATSALDQINDLLKRRSSAASLEFRPRSLAAAAKQLPDARWVLISVPGRYAAGVTREALDLRKHVFLYSDNVSIEDETNLKKSARDRGLLVMGPDCGTAIINGIGLGFANRVRRGPIGLVGAAGTGLQAVTSQIHNLGSGVSQAIGTGGRDLKSEVGGITALQGLELLAQDPETRVIVLVSKPPASEVATRLLGAARASGKPVVVDFVGYPPPGRQIENLHFASSLGEAASIAVGLASSQPDGERHKKPNAGGYVRGLFSGGTLAYETLLRLQALLAPIYSNVPITLDQALSDPLKSKDHTIVDLGEDIFTVGRLHPMLNNDLRIRRMRQEAEDPETSLILLDVVLGEGAHPNPALELAPVIANVKKQRKDLEIVALVVGTDEDPQGLETQIEQLSNAGAVVFREVSTTVEYIAARYAALPPEMGVAIDLGDLQAPFAAINVGLESFYESLVSQGAQAVQVDWRPPAGGDEKLMEILAKMSK